jgi:hypothetical protein
VKVPGTLSRIWYTDTSSRPCGSVSGGGGPEKEQELNQRNLF